MHVTKKCMDQMYATLYVIVIRIFVELYIALIINALKLKFCGFLKNNNNASSGNVVILFNKKLHGCYME
jgi:hypothetical protein